MFFEDEKKSTFLIHILCTGRNVNTLIKKSSFKNFFLEEPKLRVLTKGGFSSFTLTVRNRWKICKF